MAWWKNIREKRHIRGQMREAQQEAGRASTWQESTAANVRQEEQSGRAAQQAAAARLEEALTHAEQARAAYTAAFAAERAAPDGSIAGAEARAARRAAKEAQFYADLEVMDAQATFQWLRRAYSAPPTWLASASPDERDAQDTLLAAQGKTSAQSETEQRQAWLRYLADEVPADDAEARWFETFRESDRKAHAQHGKEHQAWQRFTQGEPPQDHAETEWFTYWEERDAFQRYAQGEAPSDEADRQRFARFEQELAAYGEPGREALDPRERQPQNQAEQATSRTAGLAGQHHQRGHQGQEQPADLLHDGPETAAVSQPAGRGADYEPTATDPAEPEQTGQAAATQQRHAQGFPSRDRAGASLPGQLAAAGREPTAPSRPWRQSAYATDHIHRQGQANPEADFEAGS